MDNVNNNNALNYTNNNNNAWALASKKLVNGDRVFNQWTGINSDSCEYKQLLNLATKPMEYYVNSLNNISGLPENEEFLSFTPIGNATVYNIPNMFDRPIPSTLQRTSSTYTPKYSTSPFLGNNNNVNVLDTDNDLILKTGLTLRSKNNQSELSAKNWPKYGDISSASLDVSTQNFGQFQSPDLPSSVNSNISGLNVMPNHYFNQRMQDPSRMFVNTYVANQNYFNGPSPSPQQYNNVLLKTQN
tara:strand:+ start:357 stop:1088 length:732 start_codon:yes stop_codon:yes gene_type:complete